MQERYSPTAWFLISHLIPLRGLFPPYSLTLIKLRKSHLGNSSELK